MKIAILTDTGSGMTIKEANNYGIYLLSLQIVYKDKTYKEGIDITTKELENILEEGEFPTTASPNVYEVNQLFEQIAPDMSVTDLKDFKPNYILDSFASI